MPVHVSAMGRLKSADVETPALVTLTMTTELQPPGPEAVTSARIVPAPEGRQPAGTPLLTVLMFGVERSVPVAGSRLSEPRSGGATTE